MEIKTFKEFQTINEMAGDSKQVDNLKFSIKPKFNFILSAKYIDGSYGNWSVKDNEDTIVLNGYMNGKIPVIEYSSAKISYFQDELFTEIKKQIKKWL